MLNAAIDAVLLDFEALDTGEINRLVIGVAACAKRVKVLWASPPLEDIDPGGIYRIGRDRKVETTWCLAGEAHRSNAGNDMGVSVRWIEDEVTADDEHPPIVPTNRCRQWGLQLSPNGDITWVASASDDPGPPGPPLDFTVPERSLLAEAGSARASQLRSDNV